MVEVTRREAAMDNKINESRRKISFLRSEMLIFEDKIRRQINRDEDCSAASVRLMEMRVQMTALIRDRNALGGHERMLNVDERLSEAVCRDMNDGEDTMSRSTFRTIRRAEYAPNIKV
jgi:hypothetical protein